MLEVGQRGRVLAAGQAVDLVVGAHHRVRVALLHGGAERRLVDLLERPLGHGDIDAGAADRRVLGREADPAPVLVVGGVVLERRDDVLALGAADHLGGGVAGQVRILTLGFRLPARQRRAVDVNGRAQPFAEPLAAGLGPDHLPVGRRERGVERRRERLPGWHRRGARVAEAVWAVVGLEDGGAEAREGREIAQRELDLLVRVQGGEQLTGSYAGRLAGVAPRLARPVRPIGSAGFRLGGRGRRAGRDDRGEHGGSQDRHHLPAVSEREHRSPPAGAITGWTLKPEQVRLGSTIYSHIGQQGSTWTSRVRRQPRGSRILMTDKATSDLWWKNAVIYCADVATWLDSDGDGTGDLAGLTRRLDYLWGLGINTLWLMPFYPSPLGDDGYDITDYYAVDPRLGTLGDFVEMIRTADNLGIRVLVDLVMSHTSNQHPWFLRSRRDRGSRY